MYTPYLRTWEETVDHDKSHYLENCGKPRSNHESIRNSETYGPLFGTPVPDSLEGFELKEEESRMMGKLWPAGEEAAAKVSTLIHTPFFISCPSETLDRFLHTKSQPLRLGAVDPLSLDVEVDAKRSRIMKYDVERDKVDCDSSSHIRYLPSMFDSFRLRDSEFHW